MPQNLIFYSITFGCDPEFFFSKSGKILGAEKILPEGGMIYKPGEGIKKNDGDNTTVSSQGFNSSKIVIDGVQAELNPRPNTCRANLANEISCCMTKLYKEIIKTNEGLSIDFSQNIKVDKKEFTSLSEKSKRLGCAASANAYGEKSKINIKKSRILTSRSAGGHIHIGTSNTDTNKVKKVLQNAANLVPLLDAIVGNTCVLIDRDPGNIKRRRLYGRAGEYRTPKHGLEYRVLSNFWLRNYALMSFVMGLVRQTVIIAANSTFGDNYAKMIQSAVKRADIKKAINQNDFAQAYINFKKIEPLLCEMFPENRTDYPLTGENMNLFRHFVRRGLDHWFKEEPLKHWVNLPEGHDRGWETFLETKVKDDLTEANKEAKRQLKPCN